MARVREWLGRYQRFHRFLLPFPESALALLKLTVERLIAQRRAAGRGAQG